MTPPSKPDAAPRADTFNFRKYAAGIVRSTSATLVRNLRDEIFPDRLGDDRLPAVRDRLLDALKKAKLLQPKAAPDFGDSPRFESILKVLEHSGFNADALDRHRAGAAVVTLGDTEILINAEEHLSVFALRGHYDLFDLLDAVTDVAESVGKHAKFAFNRTYGFLASNPANVGTGLRLSCDLCLIGLCLTRDIESVLRAVERIGYDITEVATFLDDNEVGAGFTYRVRNIRTIGSEEDIAAGMADVCDELIRQEYNARLRLVETKPVFVADLLVRTVAVMNAALLLSYAEALDMLASLNLGVYLGLVNGVSLDEIEKTTWMIAPPAFTLDEKDPSSDQVRTYRADYLRRHIGKKIEDLVPPTQS